MVVSVVVIVGILLDIFQPEFRYRVTDYTSYRSNAAQDVTKIVFDI